MGTNIGLGCAQPLTKYCEAQGKGRVKGRLRKSVVDCRFLIVDIDFPEALHSIWLPPQPTFQEVVCRVNIGHLRVTVGHCS